MNSNTTSSKKKIHLTTLNEQSLTSTLILEEEENTELLEREQAWLEQAEMQHLRYADIDLHY
ncbi:hypothetical protein [Crocosphaera sp. Alani8]|uniref:hypothetical protein n=1 Tax=Crocosphaera sp. Alani8 TaxID=3038952 RepID=UPI00313E46D2